MWLLSVYSDGDYPAELKYTYTAVIPSDRQLAAVRIHPLGTRYFLGISAPTVYWMRPMRTIW